MGHRGQVTAAGNGRLLERKALNKELKNKFFGNLIAVGTSMVVGEDFGNNLRANKGELGESRELQGNLTGAGAGGLKCGKRKINLSGTCLAFRLTAVRSFFFGSLALPSAFRMGHLQPVSLAPNAYAA